VGGGHPDAHEGGAPARHRAEVAGHLASCLGAGALGGHRPAVGEAGGEGIGRHDPRGGGGACVVDRQDVPVGVSHLEGVREEVLGDGEGGDRGGRRARGGRHDLGGGQGRVVGGVGVGLVGLHSGGV